MGAACGLRRYLLEQPEDQKLTAAQVLQTVSGLKEEDALYRLILENYAMVEAGESVARLCARADQIKAQSLSQVI